MADKQVPLSIVIRTVDKATAGINAVNKRLDELTRPTRDLHKALSDLAEKSGMNRLGDAFGRVGSAAHDLLGKVAMAGGVLAGFVGGAVVGVMHLVDQFSELGHVAARAGVEVDFLAGLRYAAAKAGLPVEQLDEGIKTLTQNIGQAKAGTGRMTKFLQQVSPALLSQLVHTNSTAEAVGLLVDAMHKLPDAARRAALAQKTFGDAGFVLLANGGSKAIQGQMEAYARLAGSQDEAVKSSLGVEEAMKDLNASADGVKAALVTGLAPAIQTVIEKMTAWLVGHRAEIAEWATKIGQELPGAVERLVTWVGKAYDKVLTFVDQIGGWKTAAVGLAAFLSVDLVAALATLSAALLTTPVGVVITGLAAIAAGIAVVTKETRAFKSFVDEQAAKAAKLTEPTEEERAGDTARERERIRREAYSRVTGKSMDDISYEASVTPTAEWNKKLDRARDIEATQYTLSKLPFGVGASSADDVAQPAPQQAKITIDIKGAPKGTRATIEPGSTAAVDMTVGHQTGGAW